jgi:hypothetical protein
MEVAQKRFRGDKKRMADKLTAIYRFAHSSIEYHSCYTVHDNWRKEAVELLRHDGVKKDQFGIVQPQKGTDAAIWDAALAKVKEP